jgi:hypothetical protein
VSQSKRKPLNSAPAVSVGAAGGDVWLKAEVDIAMAMARKAGIFMRFPWKDGAKTARPEGARFEPGVTRELGGPTWPNYCREPAVFANAPWQKFTPQGKRRGV